MSLSTREIELVVEELQTLVGRHVREIAQIDSETYAIRFRGGTEDTYLCLCATPGLARIHLLRTWPKTPKSRHTFLSFLKSHFRDTVLESISQLQGDRIVEFVFRGEKPVRLIAELTGSHTNIICNSLSGEVLEALRHVRLRDREVFPRVRYVLPPAPTRETAVSRTNRFENEESYSAAIEDTYARLASEVHFDSLRKRLKTALKDAEQKVARKVSNIEKSLVAMGKADKYRAMGELLKVHLRSIRRGMRSIELTDSNGEAITISLDPKLSPVENMRRCFRKYKKAIDGREQTEQRLTETQASHAEISSFISRLELASDVAELEAIETDMISAGLLRGPKKRSDRKPASEPRKFLSSDGLELLVGRNNQQNDQLTLRVARGNDLWVHVQTIAGSHVIVRTPPGKTVPLETLLDAANLAVYYSKARESKGVFVDYVQRKHVRKPKGSRPGYVTYSHNKTIIVDPDAGRLKRILATSVGNDD